MKYMYYHTEVIRIDRITGTHMYFTYIIDDIEAVDRLEDVDLKNATYLKPGDTIYILGPYVYLTREDAEKKLATLFERFKYGLIIEKVLPGEETSS